jgi:hypothetical protein
MVLRSFLATTISSVVNNIISQNGYLGCINKIYITHYAFVSIIRELDSRHADSDSRQICPWENAVTCPLVFFVAVGIARKLLLR